MVLCGRIPQLLLCLLNFKQLMRFLLSGPTPELTVRQHRLWEHMANGMPQRLLFRVLMAIINRNTTCLLGNQISLHPCQIHIRGPSTDLLSSTPLAKAITVKFYQQHKALCEFCDCPPFLHSLLGRHSSMAGKGNSQLVWPVF